MGRYPRISWILNSSKLYSCSSSRKVRNWLDVVGLVTFRFRLDGTISFPFCARAAVQIELALRTLQNYRHASWRSATYQHRPCGLPAYSPHEKTCAVFALLAAGGGSMG